MFQSDRSPLLTALLKAVCYLVLFLGFQMLVSAAVMVAVMSVLGTGAAPVLLEQAVLGQSDLISLLSGLLTLLFLVVFYLLRRKNPLREVGIIGTDSTLVWSAAAVTPALYFGVSLLVALLPQSLQEGYEQASSSLNDSGPVNFFATVLVAPLVEEAVFRGAIQSRLNRALTGGAAVVLSALVFAVCHGQPVWIAYAFVMGFLLGRMRMASGSLLPALAAHVTFNLLGFLVVALEPTVGAGRLTGILLALAVAGLLVTRRQLPRLFGFGRAGE